MGFEELGAEMGVNLQRSSTLVVAVAGEAIGGYAQHRRLRVKTSGVYAYGD